MTKNTFRPGAEGIFPLRIHITTRLAVPVPKTCMSLTGDQSGDLAYRLPCLQE